MLPPDIIPTGGVNWPLVALIDARLPQTQCTRCGYPNCLAYAQAIERADTEINRCPPGGHATIASLAVLLDRPLKPLDPLCGREQPRGRAVIDEDLCIGCRKCIDACPVDAIIGARRLMHSVIAQECSGCELCLPVCPVDCIAMIPIATVDVPHGLWDNYGDREADNWRERSIARIRRLALPAPATQRRDTGQAWRKAEIRAAVERARRKRQGILQSVPKRPTAKFAPDT